jgi:hypothetical protein
MSTIGYSRLEQLLADQELRADVRQERRCVTPRLANRSVSG